MRRTLVPVLALIAGLLWGAGDVAAQDWRDLVMKQLDTAGGTVRSSGRTDANILPRNQVIGVLNDGTSSYIELSLEAEVNYMLVGACDHDCQDLDLRLFRSADFEMVSSDVEADDVPIIMFKAPSTGLYLLGVDMADCEEDICYYGFRAYQQ